MDEIIEQARLSNFDRATSHEEGKILNLKLVLSGESMIYLCTIFLLSSHPKSVHFTQNFTP